MCSQPPRKTHVDRFARLTHAGLLAPPNLVIGITGGEPTLYKHELFALVEQVLTIRPDLEFHILTNAQHFDEGDIPRLRQPLYSNVTWGIPLYASEDRKRTRLNSRSLMRISYAVFCLKKKTTH